MLPGGGDFPTVRSKRWGDRMEEVNGYVEHIVFQNSENGYTVMNLISGGEEITCVGMCKGLTQGENITACGEFVEHPVYGAQFKMSTYQVVIPKDSVGMERYLGSGAVKGVGAALAARIVKSLATTPFESSKKNRSGWRKSKESVSARHGRLRPRWRRKRICGTRWFICSNLEYQMRCR